MLINVIKKRLTIGPLKHEITFYRPLEKSKLNSSEHVEQVNLVNWLNYNHPTIAFHAIINEQSVDNKKTNRGLAALAMAKQKKQGLKSGTPDLFLAQNGKSLFIEMKKHNGVFSDLRETQRDEIFKLNFAGQNVVVCFGFSAAKAAIVEFFEL